MMFHAVAPRPHIHKQGCRCKRCRHPEMPWDQSVDAEIREGFAIFLWGVVCGVLCVGAYAGLPPLFAFARLLLGNG